MAVRLPLARSILASHDNKNTLVRYIALQAREMASILQDSFAFIHLQEQLPHPLDRTQDIHIDCIERGVRALRNQSIVKLAKMFDHGGNLGFDAIIKEYRKGSVAKDRIKQMSETVAKFRQKYSWLFKYRHTVIAHTDRQRKTNEFHSADLSNELLCEAIQVMDMFVEGGKIPYSFANIDLRQFFECDS